MGIRRRRKETARAKSGIKPRSNYSFITGTGTYGLIWNNLLVPGTVQYIPHATFTATVIVSR